LKPGKLGSFARTVTAFEDDKKPAAIGR
jgi:hypothetical protein